MWRITVLARLRTKLQWDGSAFASDLGNAIGIAIEEIP